MTGHQRTWPDTCTSVAPGLATISSSWPPSRWRRSSGGWRGSLVPEGPYIVRMSQDAGYFGPDSVSWRVHREVTVLFGGARALLMQAAPPLVVAGADQTGMYERNPWKRLQRTLILTYTMTFGTKAQADAAAARINDVHTRIKGIDPVPGKRYD